MKLFLSKYWKKILIFITGILIFINIIHKSVAPRALVSEFAKYGPNVSATKSIAKSSEILSTIKESVPVTDGIFRIGIILVIGLIAAVILSELANKAPSKKK